MSAERVILAEMISSLRGALDKEVVALQRVLFVMDREESLGEGYRSGVSMGAFSISSIQELERGVQKCVAIFENILGPIGQDHLQVCREPIARVSAEGEVDAVLRRDIYTLARRIQALEELEQEILALDEEEALRILGPDAGQRLEAEIDEDLRRLG